MTIRARHWLTLAKWLLMAAVLGFTVRALVVALEGVNLDDLEASSGWLAACAGLYLTGVGFSWWYWRRLLMVLGQRPGWLAALRAYYLGHLGKYVPGKALVVVMRSMLVRGPQVQTGVAAVAVVYETLIFIAAGALLAALLLLFRLEQERGERFWQVLLLVVVAGMPVLPWVFNRLIRWTVGRFLRTAAGPPPELRVSTLLSGILFSFASWFVLGLSLWTAAQAVTDLPLDAEIWFRCTAYLCLATVTGFVIPAPGGLGVREYVLMELFSPSLGPGPAALVAVLLRLAWIASEGIAAIVLYPLPWLTEHNRTGAGEPTA